MTATGEFSFVYLGLILHYKGYEITCGFHFSKFLFQFLRIILDGTQI